MSSESVLSLLVSTANKSIIYSQAKYQLFLDLVTDLENYKILMKQNNNKKRHKQMERYTMFFDRKKSIL